MSLPVATLRMTKPLLLIAALVVALAFALWGAPRGIAALVGALLSLGNWFALRWLASRLATPSAGGRSAALSLLLIAKIGLLIAIVFVLIHRLALDAVGLAFGLSVLFLGPVLAGLLAASAPASRALNSPAREER